MCLILGLRIFFFLFELVFVLLELFRVWDWGVKNEDVWDIIMGFLFGIFVFVIFFVGDIKLFGMIWFWIKWLWMIFVVFWLLNLSLLFFVFLLSLLMIDDCDSVVWDLVWWGLGLFVEWVCVLLVVGWGDFWLFVIMCEFWDCVFVVFFLGLVEVVCIWLLMGFSIGCCLMLLRWFMIMFVVMLWFCFLFVVIMLKFSLSVLVRDVICLVLLVFLDIIIVFF